jgi:hypothetical protein
MQAQLEAKIKFIAEAEDMKAQFKRDVAELQIELAKLRIPLRGSTIEGDLDDYYKKQKKQKKGTFEGAEIEAGAVAGGVAAGVLILADVIKDATKQSKILTMIQETIGNMLGLLIDVILIPFLPIIVWAIVNLYNGIMAFKTSWDLLFGEGLAKGLVKLSLLLMPMGVPAKIVVGILDWLFIKHDGQDDGSVGINVVGTLAGDIGKDVWDWLYNLWYEGGKTFWYSVGWWTERVDSFLDFMWGVWYSGGQKFWASWVVQDIAKIFTDLQDWAKNGLKIIVRFVAEGLEFLGLGGKSTGMTTEEFPGQEGFVDRTYRKYPAGSYESGQPAKTPTVNASFSIQVKGTTVEEIKIIAKEAAKAEARTWRVENQTVGG